MLVKVIKYWNSNYLFKRNLYKWYDDDPEAQVQVETELGK